MSGNDMGGNVSSGASRCRQCGAPIQAQWRVCPMCGVAMAPASADPTPAARAQDPPIIATQVSAPSKSAAAGQTGVGPHAPAKMEVPPIVMGPMKGPLPTAQLQASHDRQWIGVGLLVLGVLGMVGGAVTLFQSSTIDSLRFDSMLAYSVAGGGLLLVMVIVGLVIMTPRGGDSSAVTSHVILSTTVSVLMGTAMAGVIGIASIVYMFNDCVRGCQGKPNTSTNYNPPPAAPTQMQPREAPVVEGSVQP